MEDRWLLNCPPSPAAVSVRGRPPPARASAVATAGHVPAKWGPFRPSASVKKRRARLHARRAREVIELGDRRTRLLCGLCTPLTIDYWFDLGLALTIGSL